MIDPALVEYVQQWWDDPRGWCYTASEAIYHLSGGKSAGITPMQGSVEVDGKLVSHWWLRDSDGSIVDATADQFDFSFPYENGIGRGFMPKMKKDTKELIAWIKAK